MSTTMRRVVVAAALTTVAVVTADALIVPALDKRKECVRTAAWVAKHANDLPSTLQALAAYPVSYRRAIFAALPPEVRSKLFLEQYRQFAASRALTTEQKDVLAEVMSLTTASMYAANGKHSAQTVAAGAALARRIKAAFPGEERTVFYQLGPNQPVGMVPRAVLLRLQTTVRSLFIAHAEGFECVCSYDSEGDCAAGSYCGHFEPPCDWQCCCGYGWLFICDGLCWHPGLGLRSTS